ncbi:hypothetical protein IV203_005083 [Nitzschia inconspicua]|uniref:Uncharacterized protein n=1 Tax=Nitzschia inconspicua TaxID=303405 RepID=A0A9K3PGL9_9STRA|nr:hypothetical protein IV203_005083 [Nitzschia inconspicua]
MSTDKLSSPSSSSAGNNSGYSPLGGSRATTSSNDNPYLVIRKEPPSSVYSNESFEVEIELELPKTSSPPSTIWANEPIELTATLHDAKSGNRCTTEAVLVTEPMKITMPPSINPEMKRCCRVRCMIRMDSIRRDTGAALEVRFAPKYEANVISRASFIGTSTRPINMVNYKMRISMEEEWESVWYKDEGGRDKSMEVFASIYDKDGQLKTGEQIPLLPVLCYQVEGRSPSKVANQDILRTLGSNKIFLDKDTGKARVRFRVEDVSKNHQGQDFILQIAPEPKTKGFKDVAPAYTPAVNVRSKRNKRSRNNSRGGLKDGLEKASPAMSRQRVAYEPSHTQSDNSFDRQDSGRLREAMKSVITWADEVVNGLYPLQWTVMGYPQHPDGSPDYSRPYHNMPNPNGLISRILSQYSDQVRDNLRVLLNAVEQSSSSGNTSDDYNMSMALPREPTDPYSIMGAPAGVIHPAARAPLHPSFGPPDITRQTVGHGMPISGMAGEASRPVMHPSITSEAFRSRPDSSMAYPARTQLPPMPGLQMAAPPQYSFHGGLASSSAVANTSPTMEDFGHVRRSSDFQSQRSHRIQQSEDESRESEVEYVLAKQYKALRTGERLGFPAYSANKEILGFYRDASGKVGVGQFVPISRHSTEFGPLEIMQATEILEDAIAKKSAAVHALKDWGTISNLLDHALVYDWSKDIGGNSSAPTT